MSLVRGQGLIVSGRNISFKPFDGGETQLLLDRDEQNGNVGYNDITTDAAGRVYAGSLGNSPVFDDGRDTAQGDLHLIDLDGSSRIVGQGITLTNGLGFSPDGNRLYHSDTRENCIYQYEVHDDASLSEKTVFLHLGDRLPDGLVISEDGAVWVALAGEGGGVQVINEDGSPREFVPIPVPMCTSVCFGGENLDELYIVSGSGGQDTDRGGNIYRVHTQVRGLAVPDARLPG